MVGDPRAPLTRHRVMDQIGARARSTPNLSVLGLDVTREEKLRHQTLTGVRYGTLVESRISNCKQKIPDTFLDTRQETIALKAADLSTNMRNTLKSVKLRR